VQQASEIDDPEAPPRILLREAVGDHCRAEVIGHARRRRPGAQKDDLLLRIALAATLIAALIAPRATAAVPWMSSLKVSNSSR